MILFQAAICRCSQPLSGFSARCLEDEQMLDCILKTNPNASYMYVVDTRPKVSIVQIVLVNVQARITRKANLGPGPQRKLERELAQTIGETHY